MSVRRQKLIFRILLNRNIRCIEIPGTKFTAKRANKLNRNIRCIEISDGHLHAHVLLS